MGTLRQAGVITQSSDFPKTPNKFTNMYCFKNSAGYNSPYDIISQSDIGFADQYVRLDDGGVFTNYDVEAEGIAANDVFLLPAVEAINDAVYFGCETPFEYIRFLIGTAGVGNTIVWEYYNGAWVSLSVTDGTSGFTAAAGIQDVTFTEPTDWIETTINAVSAYWIRARCTVASFTTQPLASMVWVGSPHLGEAVFDLLCEGNETHLIVGTKKTSNDGIFDVYVNNVLDSSGYDDYNATDANTTRNITLIQPIRKGWNEIKLKLNGKNAASTNYGIDVYGIAVY